MKGLIVGSLLLMAVQAQAPAPPSVEQQLANARKEIQNKDAALERCNARVGSYVGLVDDIKDQLPRTIQLEVQKTVSEIVKKAAEKGFDLDPKTGEVKALPKKEAGK